MSVGSQNFAVLELDDKENSFYIINHIMEITIPICEGVIQFFSFEYSCDEAIEGAIYELSVF